MRVEVDGMQNARGSGGPVEAVLGYAANERGNGLAYARVTGTRTRRLLRVAFCVVSPPPLTDRAVGYAAVTTVTRALLKRGIFDIHFVLGDAKLVDEIATGRDVADALSLAYVRLRCALNSLANFIVSAGQTDDLTQRARAEVALKLAA
jgi:hypothetical protein